MIDQESFLLPGRSAIEGRLSPEITLDLPAVKAEVLTNAIGCQSRGLIHSYKWLSEILFSLR